MMRGDGDGDVVKCWSRQEGGRTRARQLGPTCHCVAQPAIWIIQGQTGGMESNCDRNHNHANRNILMLTQLLTGGCRGGWWEVLSARLTKTGQQMRHLLGTVHCILGHGLSQVIEEIDKRPFWGCWDIIHH